MGRHEAALRILLDRVRELERGMGYHSGQVEVLEARRDYEINVRGREPEARVVRDLEMHRQARAEMTGTWEALCFSVGVLEADEGRHGSGGGV